MSAVNIFITFFLLCCGFLVALYSVSFFRPRPAPWLIGSTSRAILDYIAARCALPNSGRGWKGLQVPGLLVICSKYFFSDCLQSLFVSLKALTRCRADFIPLSRSRAVFGSYALGCVQYEPLCLTWYLWLWIIANLHGFRFSLRLVYALITAWVALTGSPLLFTARGSRNGFKAVYLLYMLLGLL